MLIRDAYSNVAAAIRYLLLAVFSVIISLPLIWMILSAFKGVEELWRFPPTLWPQEPTISGFQTLFNLMPFIRFFGNSALVSVCATSLVLFTSSLAGYVFAKIRFRGRDVLFALILGSMMIPFQLTVIQNYITIKSFGWLNTYKALIIPQGISVFGIFLMRQFYHGVPQDYLDAARLDGLREFGIYLRVVVPLGTAAISALAIFAFRSSWDNFLWPLIMINTSDMRTLPLAIAGLATVHSPEMQLLIPAATLGIVPMLIVFFIFQHQFVEGVTMSGLKT